MRVPPGYGSRTYYTGLDANSPNVRHQYPASGRVNYIVRLYPFGFYALEALWMRATSTITGSLSAMFFAGRILCVLLTMLGLYFNYRTARNLGVAAWTSVALVAAIGFFPMTSLISSYVQPDNLTYALLSTVLFFASRLRQDAASPARIAPLGLALGLLSVTKYHFFLSTGLPVAALVAVALFKAKISARRAATVAAWLLVPAIALLSVQHWGVDSGAAIGRTAPSDINVNYLQGVVAQGAFPAIRYVIGSLLGLFLGCFISGICSAGFWQVLGWGDVPIVIGNATSELWIRLVISLTTLFVAAVVLFYCVRNVARLVRAAARGHAEAAASIAAGDPVLNSYLCYAAIIAALYVMTNDVFGVSGRHWYPYIFPAFLCLVWYAPRALVKDHARLGATLACLLLAYSLVAAPYAVVDAAQRYYGPNAGHYAVTAPPLELDARAATGALWPLQNAIYNFAASRGEFSFDRGSQIAITGSAISGGAGASPVAVLVDATRPLPVLSKQYLFGIAEVTHSLAAGYSGFGAYADTAGLSEGAHFVSAYAQIAPKGAYEKVHPMRLFFVTSKGGRFSQDFLRALAPLPNATAVFEDIAACRGRITKSGGVATTHQGSILLLTGNARRSDYKALWILAGDQPYPAKLSDAGSFVAKLPTSGLPPGLVSAAVYATNAKTSSTLVGRYRLRVLPAAGQPELLADPPAACADPLRELAAS
jgi:hypothetical protein